MEQNSLSLNHEQCLTILHGEIEAELKEFKQKKFKFNHLIKSFLVNNRDKFIHNISPIFICSVCLFASLDENYLSNLSNAIIILLLACFNILCILFVYFKRTSIIYSKAKFVLTLIESKKILIM